jgi:SAM-dependent methyltransferase
MTPPRGPGDAYILGHTDEELERLVRQARFFGAITDHLFREAGIGPGMRVLDVGCGAGDVAFAAARIVGPSGAVTGVDRSPEAVVLASRRAEADALENVTFRVADAADVGESFAPNAFDALVGRLVLMYSPDPAAWLRNLLRAVRPGGIVTFQEFDIEGARSSPPSALYDGAVGRLRDTFRRAGAETRMGLRLGRVFEDAGLPAPQMLLGARVERGTDSTVYQQIADVTRTLVPLMEKAGVATAAEVGIDTLAGRLRDEASRSTPPSSRRCSWRRGHGRTDGARGLASDHLLGPHPFVELLARDEAQLDRGLAERRPVPVGRLRDLRRLVVADVRVERGH